MINKKDALNAMKGLKGFRSELDTERKRLAGSVKKLRKHAKDGTVPDWAEDAMKLYRSPQYSHLRMMRLLRKNKLL